MHQRVDVLYVYSQVSRGVGRAAEDSFLLPHRHLNDLEATGSYIQIVSHEFSVNANGGEDTPLTLGKKPLTLGAELQACLSGGTKLSLKEVALLD